MRAKPDKQQQTMRLETTTRMQLQAALSESAGAWSDEDYPDLMSVEDVNQYVRQLREAGYERQVCQVVGPSNTANCLLSCQRMSWLV